jgi:hypothetical protein
MIGRYFHSLVSIFSFDFLRSEDHLRQWEDDDPKKKGGIIPLDELMYLFSGSYFKNRRDPDYFSHMGDYLMEMVQTLEKFKKAGNFWQMKGYEKLGLTAGKKVGLI